MAKNLQEMLEEILNLYDATPVYSPKTEEERRAQAEDEYKSYYDLLRQTARRQQERSDLALQQQREGLKDTYDRQREDSAKNYRNVYSQADRQMLGRGMQRSSYAAQTLANIGQEGAEAQQRLYDAQGDAEANIDAQRALLAQQLEEQLAQYDNSQSTDVMNRMRQLEDQDYTRAQESQANKSQLAASIFNLMHSSGVTPSGASSASAVAVGGSSSGGGGSYGGSSGGSYGGSSSSAKKPTGQTAPGPAAPAPNATQSLIDALSASGSTKAKTTGDFLKETMSKNALSSAAPSTVPSVSKAAQTIPTSAAKTTPAPAVNASQKISGPLLSIAAAKNSTSALENAIKNALNKNIL